MIICVINLRPTHWIGIAVMNKLFQAVLFSKSNMSNHIRYSKKEHDDQIHINIIFLYVNETMKIKHYNSITTGNPGFILGKQFSFLVQFAGLVRVPNMSHGYIHAIFQLSDQLHIHNLCIRSLIWMQLRMNGLVWNHLHRNSLVWSHLHMNGLIWSHFVFY